MGAERSDRQLGGMDMGDGFTWPGHLGRLAGKRGGQALASFFATGRRVTFARGDALICDGDPADCVYDVLEGELILARHGADGRRQVLGFIGRNNLVGVAAGVRFPFGAMAVADGFAIRYERRAVEGLVRADPAFAFAFVGALETILETVQDHLYALGQRSALERVAAFILHQRLWQARFGPDAPRKPRARVDLPMSRRDIADFMGLTLETVSRCFTRLKRSGAIALPDPNTADIRNLAQLRELAGARDFATNPDALN